MTSFQMPRSTCPYCGHDVDFAANAVRAGAPVPGDVTVCIKCAAPSVFDDDLQLRKPGPIEALALLEDDDVKRVRQAVLEARPQSR